MIKQQQMDQDERCSRIDATVLRQKQDVEDLAQSLHIALQQKPDFSDLEAIAHKLHAKVEHEKVQDLFTVLRKEVLDQIAKIKKDAKANKAAKAKDKEWELANEKLFEEVKKCNEKILKLANQFDKELTDRDKTHKKQATTLWDDIQSLFTMHQQDTTALSKQLSDL